MSTNTKPANHASSPASNDATEKEQNATGITYAQKEDSPKLSEMIFSKVNVVSSRLKEQLTKIHSNVIDAAGIGETVGLTWPSILKTTTYKVASQSFTFATTWSVSIISFVANAVNESTDNAIPKTFTKTKDTVDCMFNNAKTRVGLSNEWFQFALGKFMPTTVDDAKEKIAAVIDVANTACSPTAPSTQMCKESVPLYEKFIQKANHIFNSPKATVVSAKTSVNES
jgi:hypothetical protein